MTKINASVVRQLASLSAIQLDDDEVESISHDLENIFGYINQLAELDTTGVEPTYQVGQFDGELRKDEVQKSVADPEQLLALADEAKDNQIKVPKVL